jgi:outer membrane protein assembly complex protein YaeT
LERIRDLYRQRGRLAVVVGPARVEGEGSQVRVTIPIQEGPIYLTDLVIVEPGFLIEEETVQSWLSLEKGEPYDALAVRRTKELIEQRYNDRGYGAVQVNVDERYHPTTNKADVAIRVRPGRLHLFGRIEIAGNKWIRDRHLRQYFNAMERDRFDLSTVNEDISTLTALGLVRAATPETSVGLDTNIIDVTIHVREPPRFEYFVGGGANGVQGVSGNLGLVARGLIGQGETWSFDGELGNRLGNVSVGYQDPHTLGRYFSWSGSFIRQNIEYPDETSDDQTSFSLRLSGLGASRWRLLSGFQWSGFTLSSSLTTPVPFLTPFLGQRFRTRRVNFDFGYEGRNQPVFPTRGTQWFVGTEVVGGPLGGDVDLTRLRGRAQAILPLGSRRRHLISFRGRAESIWSFGVTAEEGLPRFERLFLGSEVDMRGFPIREVGPKTPEGVPIGGDRLVYASAEYEFVASQRIRFVSFFDVGNVYATDLPETDLPVLRYDAGAEIRLLAPFLNLPLRFGYAFNLERINDEPPGRWFFTISARF